MNAKVLPLFAPPDDALSDDALLRACAAEDPRALSQLYRRHAAPIHRFLTRLVGRGGDAEDLVQKVFLTAWKTAARFRGESSVRSWLLGIAAYTAKDHQRATKRRSFFFAKLLDRGPQLAPSPDHQVADRQLLAKVELALAALPHDLRVAYVMCEIEEVPGAEAAEALGIPPGTLWRRLHDARKRLRLALEEATR